MSAVDGKVSGCIDQFQRGADDFETARGLMVKVINREDRNNPAGRRN